MSNLISEIRESYQKKIASLQQEIDRLNAKMAAVISSLEEDIGEVDIKDSKPSVEKKLTVRKVHEVIDLGPNTRSRGTQALDRMPLSGFGTAEWLKSINNDGNPRQVNKNRALRIFKDLMDDGMIEVIKERSGKRGGVYKKAIKELQAEPPLVGIEDIF